MKERGKEVGERKNWEDWRFTQSQELLNRMRDSLTGLSSESKEERGQQAGTINVALKQKRKKIKNKIIFLHLGQVSLKS